MNVREFVFKDDKVKVNKPVAERAIELIVKYWKQTLIEIRDKLVDETESIWNDIAEGKKVEGSRLSMIVRIYEDELKKMGVEL